MTDELKLALASLVPRLKRVVEIAAVGGGCISESFRVLAENDSGKSLRLFVKQNRTNFLDNFRCEAEGLAALAEAGRIRVPEVVATEVLNGHAYLVMSWIESGTRTNSFFADFGARLAELHHATGAAGSGPGWSRDNYLGASRQPNGELTSWTEFVATRRIGHQLTLAVDGGRAADDFRRDVEAIIDRMPDLLSGRHDMISLLHGDLWSGNYLCDARGEPVLVDPAVYRGCPEAEFGMINLFGSCPADFHQAYQSVLAFADGWQRRVSVYVLYHLLNHLNLFGEGYRSQCHSLARQILRE